jgi:hypothetical protein
MTTQLTLPFDDTPDAASAREAGRLGAEQCEQAAESRGWDSSAAADFVLAYLAAHGPTPGEVLVTEASRDNAPHDGRAFGSVFARLAKSRRIVKAGSAPRAKGHGCAGGIVWALADGRAA